MKMLPMILVDHMDGGDYYLNNKYQVFAKKYEDANGEPYVMLSIKRRDRKPIMDWRDLQWIKNQIAGPEEEGIQLFPAESRLIDTSNQYYMAVYPGRSVPWGFRDGRVVTEKVSVSVRGDSFSEQRPFAPHVKPEDLEEQEKRSFEVLNDAGLIVKVNK